MYIWTYELCEEDASGVEEGRPSLLFLDMVVQHNDSSGVWRLHVELLRGSSLALTCFKPGSLTLLLALHGQIYFTEINS